MKLRQAMEVASLSLLLAAGLSAQSEQPQAPQQQGQTQEQAAAEVEQQQALQAIMQAAQPAQQAALIEEFLKKYPDTRFTWGLCRQASNAFRQVNNYPKAIEYGERAMALNPKDPISPILVADSLAESAKRDELDYDKKLVQAEKYAREALELLPEFFAMLAPPPTMTLEEVEVQKHLLEAQPHATLGYVFLLRNQNALAEEELENAMELGESQPNQVDFLRLGRAYLMQNKTEEAVAILRKAVAMGGSHYQTAVEYLKAAEEELAKSKAATESPESKPPEPKPPQPPQQP
ncbi:MAG: hypothetical protein HY653_08095 [Acidobacteria bacterium]|nr:hypothetical protein [Acidobacteriota bacterium]